MSEDPEVTAMRIAYTAIKARPWEEHDRILKWLNDRLAAERAKWRHAQEDAATRSVKVDRELSAESKRLRALSDNVN